MLNGSKNETPKPLVDPDEILREYLHGIQEPDFSEDGKTDPEKPSFPGP